MDEKEALVHLVAWLANIVNMQANCRHEAIALSPVECREHLMMRFPIVQSVKLQMLLIEIANHPSDDEHLRAAMEYMKKAIAS